MRALPLVLVALLACGRSEIYGTPPLDPSDPGVPVTANLGIVGLMTTPNDLNSVPPGALAIADDVVIRKPGVAEPRPGFPAYTGTFGSSSSRARKLWLYKDTLLAHWDTGSLGYWNGFAWVAYSGTFSYPDTNIRPTAVEASGDLFLTTSIGVQVLDALAGTWQAAGVPKALDGTVAVTGTAGTAQAANTQLAFRHLWGFRDASGNLKLGSPSGRTISTNPAGQTAAIAGVVRVSTTVTVTTPTAHGFIVGQVVTQSGSEANFAAGNKTIVTTATSTTFTYTEAGAASSSTTALTFTPVTTDVNYTARIPSGITTSHFLQVYRSSASIDASTDPGDSLQLVYEYVPTNVDIAAGTITVKDVAPDSLRGAALYTNPEIPGGTVFNSNDPPPLSRVMASFKGSMFYGFTKSKPTLAIQMLAAGGTTGPQVGDQFFIWNTTAAGAVVAGTVENAGVGTYKVFSSGTAAQNLSNTAQSLVKIWNAKNLSSGILASYASGPDDPPGKIVFEAPASTSRYSAFVKLASPNQYWAPALPLLAQATPVRAANVVTLTTATAHGLVVGQTFSLQSNLAIGPDDPNFPSGAKTVATAPDSTHVTYAEVGANATATLAYEIASIGPLTTSAPIFPTYFTLPLADAKNGWAVSKFNQPDAVPPSGYNVTGSADKALLAFVPLRDSLLMFKEDGLWRITGAAGSFTAEPVDGTLRLLGGQLAVPLQNQVWAMTNQGVVAVPETGAPRVVSFSIEDLIPRDPSANLAAYGFAVANEAAREVMFFTATSSTPSGAYVYNAATQAWTHWTTQRTAGVVDAATGYTYLAQGVVPFAGVTGGSGSANLVTRDTKLGTWQDRYESTQGPFTVDFHPAANQLNIQSLADAAVGDVLVDVQTGTPARVIGRGGSVGNLTLTMDRDVSAFDGGGSGVTFYGRVPSVVKWLPDFGGDPSVLKQWTSAEVLLRSSATSHATLGFATNFITTEQTSTVAGIGTDSGTAKPGHVLSPIPQEARVGGQLSVSLTFDTALAQWELEGLTLKSLRFRQQVQR